VPVDINWRIRITAQVNTTLFNMAGQVCPQNNF